MEPSYPAASSSVHRNIGAKSLGLRIFHCSATQAGSPVRLLASVMRDMGGKQT
jgi:hypothetical protein